MIANSACPTPALPFAKAGAPPKARRLARLGEAMVRHRRKIQAVQWVVVMSYMVLVIVPAFQPLPPESAHIWNNLRLLAQFAFWGIWWPGVMLATMLFGRVWCGVFCPEGTLTEWASHHGLGRPVPRWLKWSGWPFVAFTCTTIYGQLISVYEYPTAALLVLGGSSVAALVVGLIYGRGKRIWCRHLCPASGVFGLLAKVAPVHFRVDRSAWAHATPAAALSVSAPVTMVRRSSAAVNCAPLIDIRRMNSASECHACGRCAGHRGAVELAARTPWQEIVAPQTRASTSEALTLIFGVLGIASAAFQWPVSPWFIKTKLLIAGVLIDGEHFLLLGDDAPWWLLTHYPAANDVFTWLDGLLVIGYITGVGAVLGGLVWAALALAVRCLKTSEAGERLSWQRLSLALVPLAGTSIFIGLTMLTTSQLKAEGITLSWLTDLRATLLAGGLLASAVVGLRLIMNNGGARLNHLVAAVLFLSSLAVIGGNWYQVFFVW